VLEEVKELLGRESIKSITTAERCNLPRTRETGSERPTFEQRARV
jgi:hypothetical protein